MSGLLVTTALLLAGCPGESGTPEGGEDAGLPPGVSAGPAGPPRWLDVSGARLAPLPPQSSTRSDRFATSDVCAQCHAPGTGAALRDAKGRDVSPFGTWKSSAMALAARDPFYLAAVADELTQRPALADVVQKTCTRCHAPEAAIELEAGGATTTFPTFDMLTKEVSKTADLGREGVACTLCHQILPEGLGTSATFTGGFQVGWERTIFGPYPNPTSEPMRTIVNYTPTYGSQIEKSALCATCHTVITRPRDAAGAEGGQFPEQVPYLEWLASSFANEGKIGSKAASCQDCHMPAVDEDGATISTAIAVFPAGLQPRKPFKQHTFAGSNVLLSRLAATDPAWMGTPLLTKADHEARAASSEVMLKKAATVAIAPPTRDGDGVAAVVTVTNGSGHKFPTGYPSRRAWLHVKVTAPDGAVVFESGRHDAYGRIVGRGEVLLETPLSTPHLDVVEHEYQTQIYESVPIDAAGKAAHRPLDAARYAKDNRLLPDGFDRKNKWAAFMTPVGTEKDANFGSTDTVTYKVAKAPPGSTIEVRLLFQVARPSDVEALADKPTDTARRLFDMVTAAPPLPVVVAQASTKAP